MAILDAHSHYMPPAVAEKTAFFKVNWSNIDRQLTTMDENGISKSLLLYPTSDAHINMGGWSPLCNTYNEAIAKVINDHPERFIGAGILPIDHIESIPQELNKIKELGLKAISLASSYDGVYLSDDKFSVIFEFARDNNMPIHVHSQIMNPIGEDRVRDSLLSPVLEYVFDVSMCVGKMMMEGTFEKYKDVKFIFAHYGGVIPFIKERFDNTYQMLRGRNFVKDLGQPPSFFFKNLYFDTSGSKSLGSLQCMLEVADADHIVFGSDFPANQNLTSSISALKESSLCDDQVEAILNNKIFDNL